MDAGVGSATELHLEVIVGAPADVVWREVRDPARIRHWHGWDAPGNDDEIRLIYVTDTTEWPAERRVALNGGDSITLHAQGASTLVRLTRAPRGAHPEMDAFYADINEGWRTFLEQLRFALERHRDAERRTIFLSGVPSGAGDPRDELALLDLTESPAGTRYDDTVVGQRVGGELWFSSEHQLGLTVDEWGDGLLLLAATPASDDNPEGGAMAVLTTYGLDDADFAQLETRWQEWWAARYPS